MALGLTPGNIAGISSAAPLSEALPSVRPIADQGHAANQSLPLPSSGARQRDRHPAASRKAPIPFDRSAARERTLIERRFSRLKDLPRIATRYGKLARTLLAAIALAGTVIWSADWA